MKKSKNLLINTAFTYALLAMAGGVFYREFTKFNGFSGVTTLGVVHTHLFLLGMVFFLLAALFQMNVNLIGHKKFQEILSDLQSWCCRHGHYADRTWCYASSGYDIKPRL